jgi:hypothetical protein
VHPEQEREGKLGNAPTRRAQVSRKRASRGSISATAQHAPRSGQYPSLGLVDTRKPTLTSTHLGLDVYAALATVASCDHRSVPPSNVLTEIRSFAGRNARALPGMPKIRRRMQHPKPNAGSRVPSPELGSSRGSCSAGIRDRPVASSPKLLGYSSRSRGEPIKPALGGFDERLLHPGQHTQAAGSFA